MPMPEPNPPNSGEGTVCRFACMAMATRFELVLRGEDPVRLRAAAEEAFQEIRDWETRLSFFQEESDIARINREAAHHPIRPDPRVFQLLQEIQQWVQATGGTFDPTVGPLMRLWRTFQSEERPLDPEAWKRVLPAIGMAHVHLDTDQRTVSLDHPGTQLDLGSVGKGFALEQAADLLEELGVENGLLHGGTSTILALGNPSGSLPSWPVAVEGAPGRGPVAKVLLVPGEALSVSAIWGRLNTRGEQPIGHVLDPRTGDPVQDWLLAAVLGPSATATDVWTTALLVEGPAAFQRLPAGYDALLLPGATEETPLMHGGDRFLLRADS